MVANKNIDRIIWTALIGALLWFGILARLFAVQILYADDYREKADDQHQKRHPIPAERGEIFDRNGFALAKNSIAYHIWTRPGMIGDVARVDSAFHEILGYPEDSISRLLAGKVPRKFVYIARDVELNKAEQLFDLKADSLVFDEVRQRVYPLGKAAAQVVGFVNPDGKGMEGIEFSFDRDLSGESGEIIVLSDALGRDYKLFQYGNNPAISGKDIHLTIDARLQELVEAELAKGVTELCEAVGGMAVFMRPSTGEILAIASYPSFEPTEYSRTKAEYRKLKPITDIYEPGSTFKIVPFAALLENNAVDLSETVFCENGSWQFCNGIIRDSEPHGDLMARSVMIHSSNIGTIKLAQRLGQDTLYAYSRAFGFGNPTNVELKGEVGGKLHKTHTWTQRSMGSIPMGHEVAVTTLQMAAAYGAVANRGVLMQPRIISSIHDAEKRTEKHNEAVVVRRVMSEAAAESLIMLLEAVVDSGTATKAKIEGLRAAGKTGTAQKVKEDGSGYYEKRFVSSFVGFAPVDNPQIVGVIAIDDPGKFPHWGGWTAAPIWKNIVSKAFAAGIISSGYRPRDTLAVKEYNDLVTVPDVRRMRTGQAREVLSFRGLLTDTIGDGFVINQSPQPGVLVPTHTRVNLISKPSLPVERGRIEIPDVKGLTLREAAMSMAEANIEFVVIGNGVVKSQSPKAGEMIDREGVCLLTCEIDSR